MRLVPLEYVMCHAKMEQSLRLDYVDTCAQG
jgi:hypothetical protein